MIETAAAAVHEDGDGDGDRRQRGEIHDFDTSELAGTFLLECYTGAQIRLSEIAKLVLELRWAGASYDEIAAELERRELKRAQPAEIERYAKALNGKLDRLEAAHGGPTDPLFGFKTTLFSEAAAARIARWFTWMYAPPVAALALGLIAFAFAAWQRLPPAIGHPRLAPDNFAFGYLLYFVSLFPHEFGHSAACLRYGGKPGRIGFTVYMVLPALFSDVGSAWKMKRWQRVIVDAGGSYFHAVVGAAYVLLGAATGWAPLFLAAALILVTLIFNLTPIFKFDGYWLVADALGVANLSAQPRRIVRAALARLRGEPHRPLPWPALTVAALSAYSALTVVVWAYFLIRIGLGVEKQLGVVAAFSALVAHHGRIDGLADGGKLFGAVAGLGMAIYFVVRLARRASRAIRAIKAPD